MQKRGSVTLIPKGQKDKRELGNWRPITLLNTVYKLISSILAKKIKKVLPRIIGKEQKGFGDGRNISDAIRGVYDTIDYANNNKRRGIMMAIDFRKAFDSIAFSFIKAVLKFFKFSNSLIDWIMRTSQSRSYKQGTSLKKYALREAADKETQLQVYYSSYA